MPGLPHHVTQRGNRRQTTFFSDADYRAYLDLASTWFEHHGLSVWAYCLMPNHAHLVLVPSRMESLARGLAETHRRYARLVNARKGWTGHLWQERFGSCTLDGSHLFAALRYVELNPVRAGLVARAEEWPWSSARHHLRLRRDPFVADVPDMPPEFTDDWSGFLGHGLSGGSAEDLRRGERTGWPLGDAEFLKDLEQRLGQRVRPAKCGPPRKG